MRNGQKSEFDFDGALASTVSEMVIRGNLDPENAVEYLVFRGADEAAARDFVRDTISYAAA